MGTSNNKQNQYNDSQWDLMIKSGRIWGAIFIVAIILAQNIIGLVKNDIFYLWMSIGFSVPLMVLIFMNYQHHKDLKNGRSR